MPHPKTGESKTKTKTKTKAKGNAKIRKPRVRPDFVFRQERLVIFVDGCFWHGCPRHGTRPRQNRKFWDEKIARNRQRDRLVTRQLRKQGWTVLRLWECALARKRLPHTLGRVKRALGK
jgi:DNA mismatch endonuclease (patch repair protein)